MNIVFEVVEVLNISRPLTEIEENGLQKEIHKIMVTEGGNNSVLFMIDGCDFGAGCVIDVTKTPYFPIIYKSDYSILKKTNYRVNTELVRRLIGKLNK